MWQYISFLKWWYFFSLEIYTLLILLNYTWNTEHELLRLDEQYLHTTYGKISYIAFNVKHTRFMKIFIYCIKLRSSGLWHHVVLWWDTNVSEEEGDWGSMDLWNVGILPHYTASQPRRLQLETSPPWKPQNSQYILCYLHYPPPTKKDIYTLITRLRH
jgi:hypothetical protein